ncbi:hypothetical protein CCP4SC76_7430015 [Gammaproteobacteria bacterium]
MHQCRVAPCLHAFLRGRRGRGVGAISVDRGMRWALGLFVVGVCADVPGDASAGTMDPVPIGVFRPLDQARNQREPDHVTIQGYRFRGEKSGSARQAEGSSGAVFYAPNADSRQGESSHQTGEGFLFRSPGRKLPKEPATDSEKYQIAPPPVWTPGGGYWSPWPLGPVP